MPVTRRGARRTAVLLLLLPACGGGPEPLPAVNDDSSCEEVAAVVEEAIDQGRLYLGTENDDLALGDQIVFALSAVDERPECVDQATADAARGLRLTIASTS